MPAPPTTRMYVAQAFGWMTVIEAASAREALSVAKARAASASLLSSDVTAVRPASAEEIDWYVAMCVGS